MTLTVLDPRPALVLVDLQKGITATPRYSMPEVLAHAASLAAAFRQRGWPVVLVTVSGGGTHGRTDAQQAARAGRSGRVRGEGWAEVAEELDPQPGDLRIVKSTWGAFHGTGLHELLAGRGVTQLVLGGVVTSVGVESTARAAYEHGYHVVLVTDAMTDSNPEAHENSVTRIFPRLGETTTTAEVLARLAEATR